MILHNLAPQNNKIHKNNFFKWYDKKKYKLPLDLEANGSMGHCIFCATI